MKHNRVAQRSAHWACHEIVSMGRPRVSFCFQLMTNKTHHQFFQNLKQLRMLVLRFNDGIERTDLDFERSVQRNTGLSPDETMSLHLSSLECDQTGHSINRSPETHVNPSGCLHRESVTPTIVVRPLRLLGPHQRAVQHRNIAELQFLPHDPLLARIK